MTIQREMVETLFDGDLAKSRWFIPDQLGVTASMVDDLGKLWSNLITGRHELALPGGAFVIVRANIQSLGYFHGRAEHLLDAFASAFDEAMAIWLPTNALGSAKLIRELMREREISTLGIR